MIGSTYKKFAKEHGMTVSSGIAYGSLYGYAASLCEGNGWKRIDVSCLFPDAEKTAQLRAMLGGHDLMKEYRVMELVIATNGMRITFHDNPGTMKKLRAFVEWFFPALAEYGVTGMNICPQCGQPIDQGTWQLVNEMAVYMHPACASRLQQEESRQAQIEAEETANDSYVSGLVGAVIGAAIGAVVWGAVLYLGYYASLVGILIGFLASKGYDMTHGKQKKGKIAIILIVTVLAVILGTVGAYGFAIAQEIMSGQLPGYALSDIFWMLAYLMQDAAFAEEVIRSIAAGMLYALLGASVILLRVHKDTKDKKIKQLQ